MSSTCICVCTHTSMYVRVYLCVFVCMHIILRMCVSMHVYVCISLHTCIRIRICDVRSENVSQRSVYTSWEMQNKLWAKNFDDFFLFDNSI